MNIRFKYNDLKFYIFLYLLIFSFFIVLLLFFSITTLSDYLFEKLQIKDMDDIVYNVKKYDENNLDSYLSNIVYNNDVCIEFVSNNMDAILYNDASTGCLLGKREISEISSYKESMIQDNVDIDKLKILNKKRDSYGLLYSIKVDNGYVFVYSMLKDAYKNVDAIKTQLLYMLHVIIILAVIVSFLLTALISKPIVSITQKSKLISNGKYDVVFEKIGIREIDDLSESLNYLESEVRKTDQYRRDLMANVSHDLKTPLTMIKAYAEMVRDVVNDDEKKEKCLNVIIDESDRMNELVGDILYLSKLQDNVDKLEISNFDLAVEINEILKRYDYLIANEEYKIIVNMPNEVMVNADRKKIIQVIYNLINNAINYTGKDKVVELRVTARKKNYLVEVIDTGCGISKKDIKNIWDKYYKNEKNHKRNKVGTGLGLSIVKNILESHKFKYGIKTEQNKGTNFYFYIDKI